MVYCALNVSEMHLFMSVDPALLYATSVKMWLGVHLLKHTITRVDREGEAK